MVPTIETLPLARLEEDPRNPNHMSEEQLGILARGIQENGFLQPCLVRKRDDGGFTIIDGHHRALAAGMAGMDEVPCVVVETDAQQSALIQIAMNKVRGELNLGEVGRILTELHSEGWDMETLSLSGYSSDELETLFAAAQPDTAEELLEGASGMDTTEDEPEEVGKVFVLELTFQTREQLAKARRGLKKVLGKGHELGDALLALLAEHQQ